MGTFTDWLARFWKALEAVLHRTSSEINQEQHVFGHAIVSVSGDSAKILVVVSRAFEADRPELTNQRREFSYDRTDDIENAAREVASFIMDMK